VADPIIRMELYETRPVVPLLFYPAGVFEIKLFPQGNSLLSTLFVKNSVGATVTVGYYEATTGEDDGEEFLLESHVTPADGLADKIIVNKIHNKPRLRVTVTGAGAMLGVYVTVVSSFAGDLDSSLFKDNSAADLLVDLGSQQVIYDPALGRHFFVTGSMGVQNVNITNGISVSEEGTPHYLRGQVTAVPSGSVDVLTEIVPASTVRKLRQIWVTALNDGDFSLQADGVEIAAGRIDNVAHNVHFTFNPPRPISAGVTIVLKYISDDEPTFACPVTAFLSASDVTI
jgi:hypothetical protein